MQQIISFIRIDNLLASLNDKTSSNVFNKACHHLDIRSFTNRFEFLYTNQINEE